MRCYFNLVDGVGSIRDHQGVEVDDVGEARREALHAIEEIRLSGEIDEEDWLGWTLEVVDEQSRPLFSIDLSSSSPMID